MKKHTPGDIVIKLGMMIVFTTNFVGLPIVSYAAAITTISQPTTLISTNPELFASDAANLVVNPNNNAVQFSRNTQATFGSFEPISTSDVNNLALLLGVSPAVLFNTDFIAFDDNGVNVGAGGFEDSFWSFTDGVNMLTHNHDFLDGPNGPVLANNERIDVGDQYNSIFGTSFASGEDLGVILFDLSAFGLDVNSSNFRVALEGGGLSCGNECPDVTFMGTVSTVPIPPALWLFFGGLLGLLGIARRGRA